MNNDSKRLLVIGNGFDLACKMKTKYANFLDSCKLSFKSDNNIKDNIWICYLLNLQDKQAMSGENWIDFESEISCVIKYLDELSDNLENEIKVFFTHHKFDKMPYEREKLDLFFHTLENANAYGNNFSYGKSINYVFTKFKVLRKILFDDLQRLILQLEIYLLEQEKKLDLGNVPDYIKNIAPKNVLSFNYTHTAEKIYGDNAKYFYLHGECKEGNTIENNNNNIVLGIDEYWTDERKNTHTNYAIFKKFVQRIQKNIDVDFKRVREYKSSEFHNKTLVYSIKEIHIFGHSLDVTDKDILKKIFDFNVRRIVIYCLDKLTQGEYIANIIKIIGQEEMIQRCNKNRIEFKILN